MVCSVLQQSRRHTTLALFQSKQYLMRDGPHHFTKAKSCWKWHDSRKNLMIHSWALSKQRGWDSKWRVALDEMLVVPLPFSAMNDGSSLSWLTATHQCVLMPTDCMEIHPPRQAPGSQASHMFIYHPLSLQSSFQISRPQKSVWVSVFSYHKEKDEGSSVSDLCGSHLWSWCLLDLFSLSSYSSILSTYHTSVSTL